MQYVQLQRYQRLKIREKSQNQRRAAEQDHHKADVAFQLTLPLRGTALCHDKCQ